MDYNYWNIVVELNRRIYEAGKKYLFENQVYFDYVTTGMVDTINFCGNEILNSENTPTDDVYNEEEDRYLTEREMVEYLIAIAKNRTEAMLNVLKKTQCVKGE